MKVSELIDLLKQYPQDFEIKLLSEDKNYIPLEGSYGGPSFQKFSITEFTDVSYSDGILQLEIIELD